MEQRPFAERADVPPDECTMCRNLLLIPFHYSHGARGSIVGCGTVLQAGRSRVRVPMR
jgi:hypothetical protein